jgi:hypothetical protein
MRLLPDEAISFVIRNMRTPDEIGSSLSALLTTPPTAAHGAIAGEAGGAMPAMAIVP